MVSYFNSRSGVTTLAVITGCLIVLLKAVVGIESGSISVVSEAVQSSIGVVAALIALFAVRTADRPADENHPYGHGKAESLAALGQALLIAIAAAAILYEAVERLIHGAVIRNLDWAIAVMLFSTFVNLAVSWQVFNVARRDESPALNANGWNIASDLLTDIGVLVGLVLVLITGITALDPIIAIAMALLILKAAWDITRPAAADLLDERLPRRDEAHVRAILNAHQGLYKSVTTLRTRRAGTGRHVYAALEFPPDVSLSDAHALTEHLEEEIKRQFPRTTVVIEAESPPSSSHTPETIAEQVQQVAERLGTRIHHVSVLKSENDFTVNLHLEVSGDLTLTQAHWRATQLEDELRRELPQVGHVITHIEPVTQEALYAGEPVMEQDEIADRLRTITRAMPQVEDVHDLEMHGSDDNLVVSLHVTLNGDPTIVQAHSISEEIKANLEHTLPAGASVFVHTEPREAATEPSLTVDSRQGTISDRDGSENGS